LSNEFAYNWNSKPKKWAASCSGSVLDIYQ